MATSSITSSGTSKVVHGLVALVGAIDAASGCVLLAKGFLPLLGISDLTLGVLTIVLAAMSARGSRAAWSFVIALLGVFSVVAIFGAPKVRDNLHVPLWVALIAPVVRVTLIVFLVELRAAYRERA